MELIGYDFDFEYSRDYNNFNATLFYAVQKNGCASLEGMYCSDTATAFYNLKSHYNSILYLLT